VVNKREQNKTKKKIRPQPFGSSSNQVQTHCGQHQHHKGTAHKRSKGFKKKKKKEKKKKKREMFELDRFFEAAANVFVLSSVSNLSGSHQMHRYGSSVQQSWAKKKNNKKTTSNWFGFRSCTCR